MIFSFTDQKFILQHNLCKKSTKRENMDKIWKRVRKKKEKNMENCNIYYIYVQPAAKKGCNQIFMPFDFSEYAAAILLCPSISG